MWTKAFSSRTFNVPIEVAKKIQNTKNLGKSFGIFKTEMFQLDVRQEKSILLKGCSLKIPFLSGTFPNPPFSDNLTKVVSAVILSMKNL